MGDNIIELEVDVKSFLQKMHDTIFTDRWSVNTDGYTNSFIVFEYFADGIREPRSLDLGLR